MLGIGSVDLERGESVDVGVGVGWECGRLGVIDDGDVLLDVSLDGGRELRRRGRGVDEGGRGRRLEGLKALKLVLGLATSQ